MTRINPAEVTNNRTTIMTDVNPAYGEVTNNRTTIMTDVNPAYGDVTNNRNTAVHTVIYDTVQ